MSLSPFVPRSQLSSTPSPQSSSSSPSPALLSSLTSSSSPSAVPSIPLPSLSTKNDNNRFHNLNQNDLVNLQCTFFNETLCLNGHCPRSVSNCAQDTTTTGSGKYCYSLWSNVTDDSNNNDGVGGGESVVGRVKIKQAGCLTGHNYDCANSTKCIASRYAKEHYFCCCKEDFCNKDVYLLSNIPEHSPQQAKTSEISGSGSIGIWSYTLIPLLTLIVLIFIVLYYIWFKRRRKDLIRSKRFCEDDESVSITNQMNGLSINSCNINGTINLTGNHVGDHHQHIGNNEHGNRSIQLIEKLSTGRFGSVWKAKMFSPQINLKKDIIASSGGGRGSDGSLITSSTVNITDNDEKGNNYKIVAVKIFPPHERSSWIIEQLVFKTPQIEHENILRFLGSEKRDDPNNVPLSASASGFWLITEYHELGSLCDYLKRNTVNIDQLIKISIGIAAGLNHLHYEIPEGGEPGGGNDNQTVVNNQANYKMKPSIVHRDFKSRNVLLKPDLTPRIADFGLALIFYPNRTPAGLGQVGTRRYMAPEVLEGAISYTQDSLYRIDIYACGLVLWELVSRCRGSDTITDNEDSAGGGTLTVNDYKLPFEEEVGQNPSLEDMQEIVCQAKKRPIIQQQWLNHPFLKVICETIEECWDQDSEARLSASCILERLTILARNRVNTRI